MKYIKPLLIPACLLITLALIYFGCKKSKVHPDNPTTAQKRAVQAEATIIARKVDKQGLQHVTLEAAENIIPHSEVNKVAVSEGILDTTALYVGILKKQIENLQRVAFTSEAKALRAERKVDSMGKVVTYYKGKFIDITYEPADSASAKYFPNGKFGYKYHGELQSTQYTSQKRLLGFIPMGKKKSLIDVFLTDSNAVINDVKRLTILKDEPYWNFRVQASGNFNPETGSFGVGPAARLDAGRLSFQLNRLYYPTTGHWRWSLNGSVDLARF